MNDTPISSTPVFRSILLWSAVVAVVLAAAAAAIGFAVAGASGLFSALTGVLVAVLFLAITVVSILVANRWFGDPLYVPIFFGIVLGGWIVKFVVFIVVLLLFRAQPWVEPGVFFVALVAGVLGSLVVDVVVLIRMRVPHVGDVSLPDRMDDDQP